MLAEWMRRRPAAEPLGGQVAAVPGGGGLRRGGRSVARAGDRGIRARAAVELDQNACATLRHNRPHWKVEQGDVASADVWDPAAYAGVDLLAGGVPCPPFTIAGRQLGAADERDLFAWAIELCGVMSPRALLLENVRGLSLPRFAAYRQHVLDRLAALGYAADWRLLRAADYGVPQLRPRFVLIAMRPADFAHFTWPQPHPGSTPTVGETLLDLMAGNGWPGAARWAAKANDIAPTLDVPTFERHLAHLERGFHIDVCPGKSGDAYRLGAFKAFVGQDDHLRHEAFLHPARIS
jgi:site-specific DNA-cytosine methylase